MHGSSGAGNVFDSVVDFTGGTLAGTAQVIVSQPLDTVKVKMQSFPQLYKGMIDCLVKTFKADGVSGLYAGTLPAVVASVAENSVLFAGYGACQKFVANIQGLENTNQLSVMGNGLAGFCAAFFSTFALCPTELVKCQLQALRETGKTSTDPKLANITAVKLTKTIYCSEGVPGLFRGLTSTFAREMPGYFFFFAGYEGARELLKGEGQTKDDIGAIKTMLSGAIGGICLWVSIFPADVIKSRIQVNNLKQGMISVGIDIFRKEGPLALYNGLLPSVLRTIPATATLFLVYEYFKKAINIIV